MRNFARFKQQSHKIAYFIFEDNSKNKGVLGCQNVLWTDRKHGFLNRLVQKLGFYDLFFF